MTSSVQIRAESYSWPVLRCSEVTSTTGASANLSCKKGERNCNEYYSATYPIFLLFFYSERFHCSFEWHLTPHMTSSIETCIRRTPCIKRTLQHSPRVSASDTGFTVQVSLNCFNKLYFSFQRSRLLLSA